MTQDTKNVKVGFSELFQDVLDGNDAAMARLIKLDAEGERVVRYATETGEARIVRMLIASGAKFDKSDSCGFTPLHIASCAGNAEIVEILVEAGADTNTISGFGHASLHMAVEKGYTIIAEILLTHGADPNLGGMEKTALDLVHTNARFDRKTSEKLVAMITKAGGKTKAELNVNRNANNDDE
jgi:ankyrin repeat protein